ncbi:MAG: hypothetical protein ACK4E1_07625 [Fervidobacterium nodosum]
MKLITPEIFAELIYETDYQELSKEAQDYVMKYSGFEIPLDTEDREKLKKFLSTRLIRCACDFIDFATRYFIIAKEKYIAPLLPFNRDIKDGHILRISLPLLRNKMNEYFEITICCFDGYPIDEKTLKCVHCGREYSIWDVKATKLSEI